MTLTRPSAHMITRWVALGLLMAALFVGTASRVAAQNRFYDAYAQGESAYRAGNLAEAERLFRRAFELDSDQSRHKRFTGMQFGVYIPEYYLGLICARTNRPDEALRLFNDVAAKGLIGAKDPEYATFTSQRSSATTAVEAR